MSHLAIRQQLETRLKSQMDADHPAVIIRWENDDIDENNQIIQIAPVIYPDRSYRRGMGTKKPKRFSGMFEVEIMTPKDTATGGAMQLAEYIGDFFAEKEYTITGGRVIMENPRYKNGMLKNGSYRFFVTLEYTADTRI